MRFSAAFVSFGLLVVGCGRPDKTSQQFVGTWHNGAFSLTVSADGSFSSGFTNTVAAIAYQGKWQAKDGELLLALTNVSGNEPHESVGSIDQMKIVEINSKHLVFECDGTTNSLER